MQSFAKVTKLSNVAGRGDYISNPERQEDIVVKSDNVDWKPYQQFERENQKTSVRNNEGREIVFALPNEWAKLDKAELTRRVQTLAIVAVGKSTDMQWAVHWNKARTNLHVHIIFSERTRDRAPGTWDRDIYRTSDGKIARKAADRARDKNGNVLPPIHRKGDAKGGFTAKDKRYVAKSWTENMKAEAAHVLRQFGATIDAPMPFHQYHEGKGSDAPAIARKNEAIKLNNQYYKIALEQFGSKMSPATKKAIHDRYVDICKRGKIGFIYENSRGGLSMSAMTREQYIFCAMVTPEQRIGKLTSILRRVHDQAYAIHDDRPVRPADYEATKAAAKAAIAKQDDAGRALRHQQPDIERQIAALMFWQSSKKKKLQAQLDRLQADVKAASKEVADVAELCRADGVSDRLDRPALFKWLEFYGKPDDQYRQSTLEPSQEALQDAQKEFKALCEVLPVEEREDTFSRIMSVYEGYTGGDRYEIAAAQDVTELIRSALPDMAERADAAARAAELQREAELQQGGRSEMSMSEWKQRIREKRASEPARGEIRYTHHAHDDHDDR